MRVHVFGLLPSLLAGRLNGFPQNTERNKKEKFQNMEEHINHVTIYTPPFDQYMTIFMFLTKSQLLQF